jgi:hypothetical protein
MAASFLLSGGHDQEVTFLSLFLYFSFLAVVIDVRPKKEREREKKRRPILRPGQDWSATLATLR